MKLIKYLDKSVKIIDDCGNEFIGYVNDYIKSEDSKNGLESICLEQPPLEFNKDNIASIEPLYEEKNLVSIEDICEQLDEPIELIESELEKINAEKYIAYKRDDAFKVAANLNRMDFFDWMCDNCDSHLNNQTNFPKEGGECVCENCGYINLICKENITD